MKYSIYLLINSFILFIYLLKKHSRIEEVVYMYNPIRSVFSYLLLEKKSEINNRIKFI